MNRFALVTILATLGCVLTACEDRERHDENTRAIPGEFDKLLIPLQFENLQVLPETITRRELVAQMRAMSRSLGVRCKHCHNMRTEDYAADELEAKRVARNMLRLVEQLNRDYFTAADVPPVTCYMCHRGELEPVTALPESLKTDAETGIVRDPEIEP